VIILGSLGIGRGFPIKLWIKQLLADIESISSYTRIQEDTKEMKKRGENKERRRKTKKLKCRGGNKYSVLL